LRVAAGVEVLCHCHWQMERRAALTIILVHGLEGSSTSQYILGTAAKAWAAGMNVVRMNMRNCGGTEHLGATLYHSGLSGDVGAVVRGLAASEGLERIVLAGFSMGGNLVLKQAGEWGQKAPSEVRAVAAVSPAMDLGATADAIHLPENRLYEWNFLWGLKRRLRRKAQLYPQIFSADPGGRIGSVREFDHRVTARYCGFDSAEDYYQRSSASRLVDRIALPALVLHSSDDPFVRILTESRARALANPSITWVETEHGGHCAFLAAADGYDGRWAERRVVEFLRRF
ncbi:MAG: YheT family hydrolase, partial [Terriglobales bacterium]